MGFFSKDEIDPKLIPFIQKREGVGIVKVNNIGKYSVRLESNRLVLESYEPNQQLKPIALRDISFLDYNKGNFINEPKLTLEANRRTYVFAGVDDNDEELEAFYHTILSIKEKEQIQRQNNVHGRGMPHPNPNVTNPNKKVPTKESSQVMDTEQQNYIVNTQEEYTQSIPNEQVPPEIDESNNMNKLDPADEIRKYYELKEDGIITEEEFNKKKKQLLGL